MSKRYIDDRELVKKMFPECKKFKIKYLNNPNVNLDIAFSEGFYAGIEAVYEAFAQGLEPQLDNYFKSKRRAISEADGL